MNPHASPRRFDLWAVLCVGVYVLLAGTLLARVPLGRTPDEAAHWEYIQHLATLRSLPFFSGVAPPNPGYEFHQPPLYYILCAPLWAALGAGVQNYAARFVSLICGAVTVWLVFASARAMFGEGKVARRAGMLAALWPLHIALGAMSNNDGLAGLICAAMFWRMALLAGRAPALRDGVWIGVLAGLGLLSKSTTLTVSVVAILALWHLARRAQALGEAAQPSQVLEGRGKGKKSPPQVLESAPDPAVEPGRIIGASVLCALLMCGWYLVRNTRLYGDALAFGTFRKASDAATKLSFAAASQADLGGLYVYNVLCVLLATSWGFYGGPNSAITELGIFSPDPRGPHGVMLLAALILLASSTWVGLRVIVLGVRNRREEPSSRRVLWVWWGVAVALIFAAYAQFALGNFSGAQGRYVHAALVPGCLVASRAWEDLPRGLRFPLGLVVAIVLLALTLANVLVWRTLV